MEVINKLIEIGKLEGVEEQLALLKDLIENQITLINNFKNDNIGIESCCNNYIALCNAEVIFQVDYEQYKKRTLELIIEALS